MASLLFAYCMDDLVTLCQAISREGLHLILNARWKTPEVKIESPNLLHSDRAASVHLVRPEWFFGQCVFIPHRNAAENRDEFILRPRVNFTALSLSHYAPRTDDSGKLRLGVGELDSYPTWLQVPGDKLCRAPSDVGRTYRSLVRSLGGHFEVVKKRRILVMQKALEKLRNGTHLMPRPWMVQVVAGSVERPPELGKMRLDKTRRS